MLETLAAIRADVSGIIIACIAPERLRIFFGALGFYVIFKHFQMLGVAAVAFDHGKRKVRVAVKHFRKHSPIVHRFHRVDKSRFFVGQLRP